jgi:ketosteroid isomerase-like protein
MFFPYSPPGFPKHISGRAACVAFQRKVFDSFAIFRWNGLDLHACDDAELVFGTGCSEIILNTGQRYSNEYCLIFRIRGGEVSEFYEYFDPLRLMAAFDRAPGAAS